MKRLLTFMSFWLHGFATMVAAFVAPLISRADAFAYLALDGISRTAVAAGSIMRSRFGAFEDRARRHDDYFAGHFNPG